MRQLPNSFTLLQEIEARQDAVLRELDELNERIQQVLREYAPIAGPTPGQAAVDKSLDELGVERPPVAPVIRAASMPAGLMPAALPPADLVS